MNFINGSSATSQPGCEPKLPCCSRAALIQPNDIVVSDALNHASIIDGIRLTRASARVVPHLDIAAVANALRGPRAGRAWVITESYFSMDADSPNMQALRAICDDANAGLIVDEAHALGVLGPEGRGVCAAANVIPDVLVGTLGKAFGTQGAFVTGPSHLIDWLWNRARSFVFSTGLSPVLAATAQRALQTIRRDPSLRTRVIELANMFRQGLAARGLTTVGYGHVVPWVLGDPERALKVAEALRLSGVIAHAIRPPTVPQGTSRIRFAITARHSKADIESALATITSVAEC
jgi:8-amino-7-oxononanoate synthase